MKPKEDVEAKVEEERMKKKRWKLLKANLWRGLYQELTTSDI